MFQKMERHNDVISAYTGKGYIARIKDVDEFGGLDRLYAIVYAGDDGIDYSTCKSVCCVHNKNFFYSQIVNKEKPNGIKFVSIDMVPFPKSY